MKITDWENMAYRKFNASKINNINNLKQYLSDIRNYENNFSPEELTEGEISNNDYYAAYIFDESKIVNREVRTKCNSGWNKLVVFIASKDKINISNYSISTAGGLSNEEYSKFYNQINPLEDEKTLI